MNKEKFTLIGAGLAGPLLATYLAKRGYSVEMFERRQDMRKESISAGRSINLALSIRGNHALKEVGLYDKIKHNAICLLYTSPSPRDGLLSRMPSSA